MGNMKYCTNANHYDECSAFCRYKSAVYMLIIIIIIANTNNIATTNTFPLQWELSLSFGLTTCPTLSGSLAKQLFNDHCSLPPQKVSLIRSADSHVCKPFWGLHMRCPRLLGHCQIMLQKLFFRLRKCPEYRIYPVFLVFSSQAFILSFYTDILSTISLPSAFIL